MIFTWQQRYQMLVWKTLKENAELEIHLDPKILASKYQDQLQRIMQGSLCNLIAKTFKIISDKKSLCARKFGQCRLTTLCQMRLQS